MPQEPLRPLYFWFSDRELFIELGATYPTHIKWLTSPMAGSQGPRMLLSKRAAPHHVQRQLRSLGGARGLREGLKRHLRRELKLQLTTGWRLCGDCALPLPGPLHRSTTWAPLRMGLATWVPGSLTPWQWGLRRGAAGWPVPGRSGRCGGGWTCTVSGPQGSAEAGSTVCLWGARPSPQFFCSTQCVWRHL